ncbi:MAG: AAA family ATPase, partial [Paraclostridium sp.]
MRPIKLKLSGLNSYVDNQVIDFEKLTERGLFGIFGPTGSGKSTILDAITMAMYGNIPRNTKEYINSASDKANISYEFEIGSKDFKRRYIVDRTIKRTKTGGILTSHCRLVEIHNDEQSTVLADKATEVNKKISEVVGLTADDFTRSVVLPQGKFNDFLKLTGSERRNMLERIFGLEKYGRMLIDKVRQRKSEENKNLLILNTKLGGYEGISEEEYKNVLNELKELNLSEIKYKEELKDIELKFEKCKDIYEKQLELEKYELEKKEIDLKSKEIEEKENKLEDAYKAEKIKPYIENISS